jgi:leucyl-tRNA synthetase
MEMLNIKEDEIYWPKTNETYLAEDTIKFIVQINGKTRKIIETQKNTSEKNYY